MRTTHIKQGPHARPPGPPARDERREPGTAGPEEEIGLQTALAALGFSLTVTVLLSALLWLAAGFVGAGVADAQEPGGTDPGTTGQEIAYDQDELDMVALINGYREENGLEPLLVSDTASLAAKRHSEDMARYAYMDHDTQQSAYFPYGTTFDERMAESGYDHDAARSENIAAGGGAGEVFERWRDSPGHEANMLDPEMEVIGVGASGSEGGEYDTYWTTDFGAHAEDTATPVHRITAEEGTSAGDRPDADDQDPSSTEPGTAGSLQERSPEAGEADSPDPADRNDNRGEGITSPTTDTTATEDQYASDPQQDQYASESSEDGGSSGETGEGAEEQTESGQPEDQSPEGEEKKPEADAPEPDGEQGDAPSEDEDCDTLAGFDLSPFDPGFGAELSQRIRAKVDCKLEQHGVDATSGGSTTATTSESEQKTVTTGGTDSASDPEIQNDTGASDPQDGGASSLFFVIFGSGDSGDPGTETGRPGEDKDKGSGGPPPAETPDDTSAEDSPEPIVAPAPDKDTGPGQQAAADDEAASGEEAGSSGNGSWTLIGPASTDDATDSEEPGTGEPDTDEGPDGETGSPKLALTDEPEDDARR